MYMSVKPMMNSQQPTDQKVQYYQPYDQTSQYTGYQNSASISYPPHQLQQPGNNNVSQYRPLSNPTTQPKTQQYLQPQQQQALQQQPLQQQPLQQQPLQQQPLQQQPLQQQPLQQQPLQQQPLQQQKQQIQTQVPQQSPPSQSQFQQPIQSQSLLPPPPPPVMIPGSIMPLSNSTNTSGAMQYPNYYSQPSTGMNYIQDSQQMTYYAQNVIANSPPYQQDQPNLNISKDNQVLNNYQNNYNSQIQQNSNFSNENLNVNMNINDNNSNESTISNSTFLRNGHVNGRLVNSFQNQDSFGYPNLSASSMLPPNQVPSHIGSMQSQSQSQQVQQQQPQQLSQQSQPIHQSNSNNNINNINSINNINNNNHRFSDSGLNPSMYSTSDFSKRNSYSNYHLPTLASNSNILLGQPSNDFHDAGISNQFKRRNTLPFSDVLSTNSKNINSSRKSRSCVICNKVFNRPSGLKIHMHTHTGEKPFVCEWPDCEKTFSVRSNMIRHLKIHKRKNNNINKTGNDNESSNNQILH